MNARVRRRRPAEFGSVELRGDRFRAFYRREGVAIRAPQTFASRAEARAWLANQERALQSGTPTAPVRFAGTVATYAEAWLAERERRLSPRSVEFYRRMLDGYILPQLGSRTLVSVTPGVVREWHSGCLHHAAERAAAGRQERRNPVRVWARQNGFAIASAGRLPRSVVDAWEDAGRPQPSERKTRRGDGSATVNAAYRLLRSILATAVEDDVIAKNPCRSRIAVQTQKLERVPATPEQVQALAAAMPPRYRAALILAAWSGLRSGELRALSRRHFDLSAGTVRVERAVLELNGQSPTLGQTKTAGSRRTVALPVFVVDVLREHLAEFVARGNDALLFTTENGAIVTRHLLSHMFRRAQQRAGLESLGMRWHDLRHTGASLAYAVGASVPDVQRRLGHTTMRAASIYAHSYAYSDQAVADRLSEAFG